MLAVLAKYVLELKSKRFIPTRYPPSIPIESPIAINTGNERVAARTRGTAKYFIGSVESVINASTCSVTFMVAISAAIELATRAATISPPRTGPNSRAIPIATIAGTTCSALNLEPPA